MEREFKEILTDFLKERNMSPQSFRSSWESEKAASAHG